ncbi:MAG: DUF885 family protein, partial [Pseudomonadota bacterium]
MKTLSAVLIAFSILVSGCAVTPPGNNADEQLRALYEREFEWRQQQAGRTRDADGEWTSATLLPSVTPDSYAKKLAYWEQALSELNEIPRGALSKEEAINADVFEAVVSANANNVRFKTYEAPLNSDSFFWTGLHQQYRGFPDVEGYENYIARIDDIPRYFDEHIANMRSGLARGFTPPAVTLQGRTASIDQFLIAGRDNPFFEAATRFPPRIEQEQQEQIALSLETAINRSVVPAYSNLKRFMVEEYLPNARQTLGASELPDGEAFYQSQILQYTTLTLTPGEIHETGLSEVARIRKAMLSIIDELEFDGDLAAFYEFLRTDPQFYAKTPDELMGVSAYVDKRMAARIHDVLGFLPRQRHTIAPVPDAIAPIYTAGRGGYGRCWMNTYNLPARPLYTVPALTLHECSPGHSLQFAIAQEAPGDIPEFRA